MDPFIFLVETNNNVGLCGNFQSVKPFGDYHLVLGVLDVVISDEPASKSEFVPVAYSANVETIKSVNKVIKAHPEGTVIFIKGRVECLFHVFGPQSAFVAPITFPFKLAPWVSNFKKLNIVLF